MMIEMKGVNRFSAPMFILTHQTRACTIFLTCYIYFRVKAYKELNLVRALDEVCTI